MNNIEKLVKFVELKNKVVKKVTGINYANRDDIAEIKEWGEKKCEAVYGAIELSILTTDISNFAIGACPWCISIPCFDYGTACEKCGYGERNGICINNVSSLFYKYNSKYIKGSLSNTVYRDMIKQINKSK